MESRNTTKWLAGFRIVGFGLIMLLGIVGIIANLHKIAIALNHDPIIDLITVTGSSPEIARSNPKEP